MTLPDDPQSRKLVPLARGCLDYFPAALCAVASLSLKAQDQHHPGAELHWDRAKSADHADCIVRHLLSRGTTDTDGVPHSVKVAWRALAMAQEELEGQGAPFPRGARLPAPEQWTPEEMEAARQQHLESLSSGELDLNHSEADK